MYICVRLYLQHNGALSMLTVMDTCVYRDHMEDWNDWWGESASPQDAVLIRETGANPARPRELLHCDVPDPAASARTLYTLCSLPPSLSL